MTLSQRRPETWDAQWLLAKTCLCLAPSDPCTYIDNYRYKHHPISASFALFPSKVMALYLESLGNSLVVPSEAAFHHPCAKIPHPQHPACLTPLPNQRDPATLPFPPTPFTALALHFALLTNFALPTNFASLGGAMKGALQESGVPFPVCYENATPIILLFSDSSPSQRES